MGAAPSDRAQARLTSEFGVPGDLAEVLYVHATRQVRDAAADRALYLRYLREDASQTEDC